MNPAVAPVLPYSLIVGQEELRRALEIAWVMPSVGGVLATGERGTAKSTTVRAFAWMVLGRLPVTLPIGATDDRVLGGWEVEDLLRGRKKRRKGLLEQAQRKGGGLLYIDEINLLDDYLVNIILDAAAGGVLVVEREGMGRQTRPVRFTLVGTMNPEEGNLRPQLLDRFGLVATIGPEEDRAARREILRNVLDFEADRSGQPAARITEGREADAARGEELSRARKSAPDVVLPEAILTMCAEIATAFRAVGHRGEVTLANGAQALAAIEGGTTVEPRHVAAVAPMALVHRRATAEAGGTVTWTDDDADRLARLVAETA